jgi:tetratricopeptide (TPR) repeat protein
LIGTVDRFWRHRFGDAEKANAVRQELDGELSGLTLYPVATSLRTKGVRGGDADLTHINDAISLAVAAPELITARLWAWLAAGSHYEPVRRGMPPTAKWFIPTSGKVPYDAALRVQHAGQVTPSIPLLSALLAEAPFDYWVATEFLKLTRGDASRVLGPRLDYDLRAIRLTAGDMKDDQAALALRARGCQVAVTECAPYARALARMKRVDEAAREFERTFADPGFDRVSFANEVGWLVDYYYERKNIDRAVELAEEAAETGAGDGLKTAGYLYERLGRAEDAEDMYESIAERYEDPAQLLGFYYRAINERKQTQFEEGWKRWLAGTFPEGLQPAATPVPSAPKPARGVTVTKDTDRLRKARLQAGDLIVGLDGWRVDNLKQFRAINAFSERPDRKLTVWRGPIYETSLPWRAWSGTNVEFRTYPIQGWAE